jgi:hypothetical protein
VPTNKKLVSSSQIDLEIDSLFESELDLVDLLEDIQNHPKEPIFDYGAKSKQKKMQTDKKLSTIFEEPKSERMISLFFQQIEHIQY